MPSPIISLCTVQRALLSLDTRKAYRLNDFPHVLKESMYELVPVLVSLFCFCLKSTTFPASEKVIDTAHPEDG